MTGTLEATIHPPADEGAAHRPDDESAAARTSRSKATVRTKSVSESSKSSRSTSATKKVKASGSGATELSANGPAKATKKVKASGSRATASSATRGATNGRAKRNGSALTPEVVAPEVVEKLSYNGSASTAERPAVELSEIESADEEELQPSPAADGSQQETTRDRAPRWVAVRSWVRNNLLSSSLAVALVVAVVFLTLTQLSMNSENSLNSARTSAFTAAKSYAVDLASYNYKNLNQDFGKVLAESTPAFKQNFTQSSEALKTAIVKYHASATANVVGAGVVSATSSRAVVLIFLNQTVKNTLQKNIPTTESRVDIILLRSGGRWLIDQVSLL